MVKGLVMKIDYAAALDAAKMLVVLQSPVIPPGLAGAFDLKRRPDFSERQQRPVDRVQRDVMDVLPYHLIHFLGRRVRICTYQRLVHRHSLGRNFEPVITAPIFK